MLSIWRFRTQEDDSKPKCPKGERKILLTKNLSLLLLHFSTKKCVSREKWCGGFGRTWFWGRQYWGASCCVCLWKNQKSKTASYYFVPSFDHHMSPSSKLRRGPMKKNTPDLGSSRGQTRHWHIFSSYLFPSLLFHHCLQKAILRMRHSWVYQFAVMVNRKSF